MTKHSSFTNNVVATSGNGVREMRADGGHVEAGADWLRSVPDGKVFVAEQALQRLGVMDQLQRLSLAAIDSVCGQRMADTIAEEGFETIHRHLDGAQIVAVHEEVTRRLQGREGRLVNRFVRELGGHRGPFYISGKVWVRFFVPHDCYAENQELFSGRVGHLSIQNPHQDSWFTNPRNAIVMWIAMSEVIPGNGMLIYPLKWGHDVPHEDYEKNGFRVDASLRPGPAMDFRLRPGDILMFSGEHLHSSEINRIDKTRFVISFRFTLSPPRYGEGNRWVVYRDTRFLDTPLQFLAGLRSGFSTACLQYLLIRRFGYWLSQRSLRIRGKTVSKPESGSPNDNGLAVCNREGGAPMPTDFANKIPRDLEVGEIRAISDALCAARTATDTVVFSRHCPHQGADLAGGSLRGEKLYCPWHNLEFDLKTGVQPCRSLSNLQVWSQRKSDFDETGSGVTE